MRFLQLEICHLIDIHKLMQFIEAFARLGEGFLQAAIRK